MIAEISDSLYTTRLMENKTAPYTEFVTQRMARYHLLNGDVIVDERINISFPPRYLRPNPENPSEWLIPLSRGFDAIIDECDVVLASGRNWSQNSDGYPMANFKKDSGIGFNSIKLHRLIMGSALIVDHRNGDVLDNRRCNLRNATLEQNGWNSTQRVNSKTQMKGAWQHSGGAFRSEIVVNGQRINLGSFKTAEMAAIAYEAASKVAHREFSVCRRK
jgi:hypothetical protein